MAPAPRIHFFLLLSLLASEAAFSQPLFFLGRADAELQGAFSYSFLKSPLSYPADRGEVEAEFNIPVDLAGSAQHLFSSASNSTFVMPSILGQVEQQLNAGISASAPLSPGILFFTAGENASLQVTASLGDATFNLDTTLSAGYLRLKGSAFLPIRLNMNWRSMSLGYVFRPASWLRLGLQVQRQEILATAGGDLRPDLAGRVQASGLAFDIQYSDQQVYGTADGSYYGVAYTPQMAVEAGPVRWTARMPTSLRADGRLDMNYSVPFFIDAETFKPKITQADSFLTSDNLRRLLSGETDARSWIFHEPLHFSLPGSQTVALEFWQGGMELSYTKMFGVLGVRSQPVRADTDSVALHSNGFLDADADVDNLILLRWQTPYFRGCLGAHTVNVSYHGRHDLLSGISPLEWGGDPIAPVIQFGFLFGDPLRFHIDLALAPLPALTSGVGYQF